MIKEENQLNSLKVILELAHQSMRYFDPSCPFDQFETRAIDSLCNLVDRPEMTNSMRAFFSQQDEQSRHKILAEILEAV